MYGSHDLTQSLLEHDLVDQYQLWVHPAVLGKGRRFFEAGVERMDLGLADATVISPGVAILTHQLEGVRGDT